MKIAISLPDDLFERANALAEQLSVSRSQLFATALAEYLAKHHGKKVTSRLNTVYSAEESRLDPALRKAQSRSFKPDSW